VPPADEDDMGTNHIAVAVAALAAIFATHAATPPACAAESGHDMATVVELYTSEGCNSCPPADRWLGTLSGKPGVVTLGYHVDYWDSPEWKDRFASPVFTRRQADALRTDGARFSYTPQVLVDGQDWPKWAGAPLPPTPSRPAPVAIRLAREPGQEALALDVTAQRGAPSRLSAEVAVVDDGLMSHVGGGENRGATLRHDGVVRAIVAVPPWTADDASGAAPHAARVSVRAPEAEPGSSRHWVAVVRDAATNRPVQAIDLRCRP
jgi:hypothetical protein